MQSTEAQPQRHKSFRVDELPDGACISPKHVNRANAGKDQSSTVIREAQYAGSFSVGGDDQSSKTQRVRNHLAQLKKVSKKKTVLLIISLSGIKVCNSSGDSVYMAHALKRISYATCEPESNQFSFLAREPKEYTNLQYCHAFFTQSPEEAQELNAIVGNAFKMAYLYQSQGAKGDAATAQPSFHDVIEQQLQLQKEEFQEYRRAQKETLAKRLSQISTPKIEERLKERRKREEGEEEDMPLEREGGATALGRDRGSWAKQNAGKKKHRLPLVEKSPPPQSSSMSPLAAATSNGDTCSGRDATSKTSSPSHFSSISALKEAFMTGEMHSHGSPVFALKQSIDDYFREHGSQGHRAALLELQDDDDQTDSDTVIYRRNAKSSANGDKEKQSSGTSTNHSLFNSDETRDSKIFSFKRTGSGSRSSFDQRSMRGSKEAPAGPARPNQHPSPVRHSKSNFGLVYEGELGPVPPVPKRYESMKQLQPQSISLSPEEEHVGAPWYQATVPRELSLELLSKEEVGSFIVRDSNSHPGCYALSVKVPNTDPNHPGISHYLIVKTSQAKYKLKGLDKEWSSLTALITHHTVLKEMLPCTLVLPNNSTNPTFNNDDNKDDDDDDDDDDYHQVSDFTRIMNDLQI